MTKVKVLTKGQITLPKKIRDSLHLNEGDTLIIEEQENHIIIKKAKTIFDMAGTLPDLGKPIDKMIEDSITEEYKDSD